ncbi:MAG: S8 family serine peptidase [Actinomycetota bacterium]|nr:S8 family serine peptidase [Actinomycetota bacterium]
MRPRLLSTAAALCALAAAPAGAHAVPYTPASCAGSSTAAREVIVHYEEGTPRGARVDVRRQTGTGRPEPVAPGSEEVRILDGDSVAETVGELEAQPEVDYAVPNVVAHASAFYPNDPGNGGGWQALQWNFAGPGGVRAPEAWETAMAAGAPGGRGAVVAVLDTGVAYETRGRFRRAPDLYARRWRRGHDFVDRDRHPNDENGHGTHVTGTIAERTNNRRGVTGLAYGARIMPVRVLDECGDGDAGKIARAVRWAARRGADVINMSFEFDQGIRASQIPDIITAVRYAHRRGAVLTGAAGNHADDQPTPVAYPAAATEVISVGATTERQCVADYSNGGENIDLVAPGGGFDAPPRENVWDATHCDPIAGAGRDIIQQTFTRSVRRFGLPSGFEGTSMASPHVAATAALVIGTRRLGRDPSPAAVEARLKQAARDLGPPGRDDRYGAGLIDAAAAIAR